MRGPVPPAAGAPADARFETLAGGRDRAADKARAGGEDVPRPRPASRCVLQDLGATQDAREVWAQLAAERPDIPELAGLRPLSRSVAAPRRGVLSDNSRSGPAHSAPGPPSR